MNRNLKQAYYCVKYATGAVKAVLAERQSHLLHPQKHVAGLRGAVWEHLERCRKAHFDRPVYMPFKNLALFIKKEGISKPKASLENFFLKSLFPNTESTTKQQKIKLLAD